MIKTNRCLILKSSKDDFEKYYIEHMQLPNIKTVPIYRHSSGLLWKIIVIWIQKLRIPFSPIWYGEWKKEITKYDTVIVFDRNLNWNILKYIHQKNPSARLIVWYWNLINSENRVPFKYHQYCEEWTFDADDAKKYNINENTQFYFSQKPYKIDEIYDCFFVGCDKNRIKDIENLYSILNSLGYTAKFFVIKDKTSKDNSSKLYVNSYISYEKVLEHIKTCKCIIEMNQNNQSGLTVRTLEALFHNKKLITNNKHICKESFYNKNNILVIDSNTTSEEIDCFMKRKFVPYGNEIKHFDFSEWIRKF